MPKSRSAPPIRIFTRARAVAQDRPGLVNVGLILIVALHWALSTRWHRLAFLRSMATGEDAVGIYQSVAEVAGLVGGLAAVVVVFGMQGTTRRFRRFRAAAGQRLRANWSSLFTTPSLAALTGIVTASLAANGKPLVAMWLFEAAMLFLAHGFVRIRWLLEALAELVQRDDQDDDDLERTVSAESLFRHAPAEEPPPRR